MADAGDTHDTHTGPRTTGPPPALPLRRSQYELARQVGWCAVSRCHRETSTRTTVPIALVALARGLAIATDALRGLAVTVRPQCRRA